MEAAEEERLVAGGGRMDPGRVEGDGVEVGVEEGPQGAAAESVEAVEGEAGEWLACRAVDHAECALLCGGNVEVRLHGLDVVLEV